MYVSASPSPFAVPHGSKSFTELAVLPEHSLDRLWKREERRRILSTALDKDCPPLVIHLWWHVIAFIRMTRTEWLNSQALDSLARINEARTEPQLQTEEIDPRVRFIVRHGVYRLR